MPGPTDDYIAYRAWFDVAYSALNPPAGCISSDPIFSYVNQYTWSLNWLLNLADPVSHIRIKEHFAKIAGLQKSRRVAFAYHYGPTIRAGVDGVPQGEPSDPLFVRIDNASAPAHLHEEGNPSEHIPQERIKGLSLDEVDLFDFVRAAIEHHTKGSSIAKGLGYRVRPK